VWHLEEDRVPDERKDIAEQDSNRNLIVLIRLQIVLGVVELDDSWPIIRLQ